MNCPVMTQIDVVACLLDQNYYQRLGLKTNAVARWQLKEAYRSRLELLKSCRHELNQSQYHQARRLINQAIEVLSNKLSRQEYDSQLLAPKKSGSPVDEKILASEAANEARSQSVFDSRYELGEPLSQSERCSIYQAVDSRLNRGVVVKRIARSLLRSTEHARLFREEAELFARSNASNLVKILDYDADSGAIVLERMKHDLSQLAQQRPRDPDSVREILRDALSGLAWLHDQGMAHGRVELSHLLVDDNGGVKLAVSPGMTGVSTSFRPGRHTRHVAPELLNRQYFGPPGLGADIYAMGFVALELLCGKSLAARVNPAIEAESDSAKGWLLWHASPSEHLPNLKALVAGVPEDLKALLTRMTSKQQNERWTDARQCLTALQHVPIRTGAAIELPTENVDPAQYGVEILGTPPSLHAEYDARESISWRDLMHDPKLLTHPLARSKTMSLALCCVCSLATTLLLLNPDTAKVNATGEQLDSQLGPSLLPDVDLLANQELTIEEPVEVETPVIQDVALEKVLPASVRTSILVEDISTEEPPSIAANEIQYNEAESSEEPTESPSEIEEVNYWPTFPAFEWQHNGNPELGLAQYKWIEKEFWEISTATRSKPNQEYSFQLGTRIHDPRAPFSLALTAWEKGDQQFSKQMCDKSLKDAKQLRVPYMVPLVLMTHTLCDKGDYAAALSYCRDTLRWHSQAAERTDDPRFSETTSAIAWWTGLVVGFVEDVKGSAMATTADTRGAELFVEQTVDAEQYETYLLARLYIKKRYTELSTTRSRKVGGTVRKQRLNEKSGGALVAKVFKSAPFAETKSSSDKWEAMPYSTSHSAESPVAAERHQVDHRIASPARLSSYYPFDPRSLADQSRYTMRKPSSKSIIQ